MGQATRLNLRMQRELKLLQTDPPPGVSVRLADDDTTLTNINAKIEGPEGTVYANGFFNIKILIPERYPFHPPNVTFSTPIYHPNIDDGGRICLDILNLPPKGAWRPSLNISTVLTSIGLLLSEPNPDDGLICETSREYKYNRHSFDQKARSWTERYAKAGGGTVADAEVVEANTNLKNDAEHVPGSSKKICSISRKLSLQSVNSDGKENIAPGGGGTSISRKLSLPRSQITAASSEPQPLHKSRVVANKEQLEGSKIDDDATRGPSSMLSNILNAGVGLLNKQQKFEKTGQQVLTIIVPDSESEDEGAGPTRSRLSLKRMRLKAERNAR